MTANKNSSSQDSQEDLDIQVTVNSSDDEYQEEGEIGTESSQSSEPSDSDSESSGSSSSDHSVSDQETSFQVRPEHLRPHRMTETDSSDDEYATLHNNPKFKQLLFEVLGKDEKVTIADRGRPVFPPNVSR